MKAAALLIFSKISTNQDCLLFYFLHPNPIVKAAFAESLEGSALGLVVYPGGGVWFGLGLPGDFEITGEV